MYNTQIRQEGYHKIFATLKLLSLIRNAFEDKESREEKVISLIQRGSRKDFIDLWTIINETKYSLQDIFTFCKMKYQNAFSESISLKALTYIKDAEEENAIKVLKPNFSWEGTKKYFIENCKKYFSQNL